MAPMKLACSSTGFDAALRSGELTQLEWIDLCAHDFAADGIVLDVRHFPRIDTDYLAQVKKMATDLGLCVAALRHDGLFSADDAHMLAAFETAIALGAPLLSAPLPLEVDTSWNDVLARLGTATSLAKRHNVTLAIRNAPHTFAAGVHDLKRVSKEADSAWLRFGPDFAALEAPSEPQALLGKTVLVWHQIGNGSAQARAQELGGYLGFVALDDARGEATAAQTKSALREWRSALFETADRT
jgi:hypothetical protein